MKNNRYVQRRTFLQAMGLGAGFLPLLNSERAPAQAASGYPTRLITITWTNGIVPGDFYPDAPGPLGTLPAILSPLEPYKDKILSMRGANNRRGVFDLNIMMDQGHTYNGHNSYPSLLTGTWYTENPDTGYPAYANGPSIDQMIADYLATQGVGSPLLNLGARPYQSSTSWRAAGQRNSQETDPGRVFDSLFSGVPATAGELPAVPTPGGGPTIAQLLTQRRQSVLDFVGRELEQYGTRLGTEDREKVQAHLQAIRELENRLATMGMNPGTPMPTGGGVPVGTGCAQPMISDVDDRDINDYPNHVASILAVAGAAAKCDVARCITIDLIDDGGGNSLTFPWLGINSPDYHEIAHNGEGSYDQKTNIDRWFFEQVAALVGDLAATPEGDGSVLDNTCILIANDMNEGANHYVGDLPYLIIGSCGGFFKTGEAVGFADNVPNNQLLTTLCHAMGLDVDGVGDYSGNVDALLKRA